MVPTSTAPRRAGIAQNDLSAWVESYEHLHIDMGTGDGTFALRMARQHPGMAVLGIDTCLDNLIKSARKPPANLRFVTCDALEVPGWLEGRATGISINFPYGSLFHLVTAKDGHASEWIRRLVRPGARVDIRVNESAGARYEMPVETIRQRLERVMRNLTPNASTVETIPHEQMRTFPSTWAKRLAWGHDGRIVIARGTLAG